MPTERLYCRCGGSLRFRWETMADRDDGLGMIDAWREIHTGEGHGPTSSDGAANARRREERRRLARIEAEERRLRGQILAARSRELVPGVRTPTR